VPAIATRLDDRPWRGPRGRAQARSRAGFHAAATGDAGKSSSDDRVADTEASFLATDPSE